MVFLSEKIAGKEDEIQGLREEEWLKTKYVVDDMSDDLIESLK